MDTLFWTKLNPDICVKNVNRRFYNQYYYKLEIQVPGAGCLRFPDQDLDRMIEERRAMQARQINYGGSWAYRHGANRMGYCPLVSSTDHAMLEHLVTQIPKFDQVLKFRIEEPRLNVYAAEESELHQFAKTIDPQLAHYVTTVFMPSHVASLDLLRQGLVIKKRRTTMPFKVMVREGRYSQARKKQMLDYLQSVPEHVQLPKHFVDNMSRTYESIWNCYFYVSDPSLLTMVALIDPTFVRSVEEFHVMDPADK